MKKLLFLGFSLLCLFNLSAMDKITENDFRELKLAYREWCTSGSFFLKMANETTMSKIFAKYNIEEVPKDHNEWTDMFRVMEENIEKNKGSFRKFMDRCTIS